MSASPTCQNAPISEGVISEITITDPNHALCGRSFPLVSLRAERGRDYLVFGLPDGRRRTVRKSSTNLGAVVQEDHAQEETSGAGCKNTQLKLLGSGQSMPYKFNDGRRRKIPKAKYGVTNWPEYDARRASRSTAKAARRSASMAIPRITGRIFAK